VAIAKRSCRSGGRLRAGPGRLAVLGEPVTADFPGYIIKAVQGFGDALGGDVAGQVNSGVQAHADVTDAGKDPVQQFLGAVSVRGSAAAARARSAGSGPAMTTPGVEGPAGASANELRRAEQAPEDLPRG